MLSKRVSLSLAALVLTAAATAAFLVARDPGYDIRPGAEAGDSQCRRITGSAPGELAGQPRHGTGSPGVVVWGDRDIVLRCGIPGPGPTTDPCFAVDGVDWVIDSARSDRTQKVIISYGRAPATEVTFAHPMDTLDAALIDLSALIAPIEQTQRCVASD
ncbi:DUF3515 family protein [Streptomyces fumanus]|uniref:DUF3515 domain-containing protein n=1 Tax=Streptomyces fumanus TaxID=67302 RepID=A0A919A862_9ACTN|nr:DUF3515 family protein [Streptomyces fumanus]GHE91461.1 hypothetical protein GCM10018772_14450 [Streptomyces fumanus]